MNNSPKISIIIPIYKVEQYLSRCIDSVLLQTFTDFELLLIDDGSPDNSGNICDEYAQKDNRIKVFHKENGGVSSARNLGIINAQGEFICFVDSDDWLGNNYLINFISQLDEKYDLLIQGFIIYNETTQREVKVSFDSIELTSDKVVILLENKRNVHNGFIWHRIFRRSIILNNGIFFKEGLSFAEDGLFFYQYIKYVKSTLLISSIGYYYRIRKGSLTSSSSKYGIETYYWLFGQYVDSLNKINHNHNDKQYNIYLKKYTWRLIEAWFISRLIKEKDQKEKIFILEWIKETSHKFKIIPLRNGRLTLCLLAKSIYIKNRTLCLITITILHTLGIYEKKILNHI